ncbi:MAG TPA: Ig-like domain-containing protein [Micromonosporaceae bacterium]
MPRIVVRARTLGARTLSAALVAALVGLGLVGCSAHPGAISPLDQSAAAAAPAQQAASLAITPGSGAAQQPISTEIGVNLANADLVHVRLVRSGTTQELPGRLRADGSAWVPDAPLAYSASYEATVSAKSADGRDLAQTTSFTTMPAPRSSVDTGLYAFDGQTVGVAMPIVVQFGHDIPADARAEVQKRLFVTTDPQQPGVWSWASPREILYRAPNYWKPGTKINVRSALKGVPMGNGQFGDADREATVTVGDKVFMYVDNKAKQMQVYLNDKLARTMPVSLGKPSTPSSSGFMVTMSHEPTTVFDTRGEPNGGYVINIQWAMRLTWGGEFVHSAPWSVGSQGHTNVSHGCVNLSPTNAKWLFDLSHVGDPIIVKGTERTLAHGNGWTAWDLPWSQYITGSALPVPPELANASAVDNVTGAPPAAPAPAPATSQTSAAPAARPTN